VNAEKDLGVMQAIKIDVQVGHCRIQIEPDTVLLSDDGQRNINWPVEDLQACMQRVWAAMFPPGTTIPPEHVRW
jgi:hypothetical protein